ncbi:hypothetical protein [Marinomonas sp. PE14-40]|uniref:hypothetical protein n=1 Tax=Marinomonas sp. PE14-40 TaxID=3060621 RepID=UPI003F678BDE
MMLNCLLELAVFKGIEAEEQARRLSDNPAMNACLGFIHANKGCCFNLLKRGLNPVKTANPFLEIGDVMSYKTLFNIDLILKDAKNLMFNRNRLKQLFKLFPYTIP